MLTLGNSFWISRKTLCWLGELDDAIMGEVLYKARCTCSLVFLRNSSRLVLEIGGLLFKFILTRCFADL